MHYNPTYALADAVGRDFKIRFHVKYRSGRGASRPQKTLRICTSPVEPTNSIFPLGGR